jgi:Gpi18-like mannosyltransferase
MKMGVHIAILVILAFLSLIGFFIGIHLKGEKMGSIKKYLAPILVGYPIILIFLVGLCWLDNPEHIAICIPAAFFGPIAYYFLADTILVIKQGRLMEGNNHRGFFAALLGAPVGTWWVFKYFLGNLS